MSCTRSNTSSKYNHPHSFAVPSPPSLPDPSVFWSVHPVIPYQICRHYIVSLALDASMKVRQDANILAARANRAHLTLWAIAHDIFRDKRIYLRDIGEFYYSCMLIWTMGKNITSNCACEYSYPTFFECKYCSLTWAHS